MTTNEMITQMSKNAYTNAQQGNRRNSKEQGELEI
jgi:hypothetical protein